MCIYAVSLNSFVHMVFNIGYWLYEIGCAILIIWHIHWLIYLFIAYHRHENTLWNSV